MHSVTLPSSHRLRYGCAMTDSASTPAADALDESVDGLTEPLVELTVGPWWWVLIRGILAVIFGVIALVWPASAAIAIAFVFGAYAIVDGITEIVHAVRIRSTAKRWGWLLFSGIVSVIAGIAAVLLPILAAFLGLLFLLWMIVFYNVVHGATVIGSASGAGGKGRGWAIFAGVASIVFGVILAVLIWTAPVAAMAGLIFAVGIYAIVFGVMLAVAAIRARTHGKSEVTAEFSA